MIRLSIVESLASLVLAFLFLYGGPQMLSMRDAMSALFVTLAGVSIWLAAMWYSGWAARVLGLLLTGLFLVLVDHELTKVPFNIPMGW